MSEIEIDQLIDSTRVDGSGAEIAPPALAPLASWSEVDPDYAEFATDDSDPDEDEDADDLTQEELDAPEPDGDAATVIEPVGVELWGQNLDEGTEWVKVAEQDLDGDGEAGIAMIPNVPTATSMRYRLRLVYSDGSFSKWSEQQEVTTPRDTTPPPVPSAPWVHTQYGHTQAGWDGQLAADSPIDFDHTRLYVQQMGPESGEEPPEGGYVAGDPQLVTRFSSEGYHMLGFLPEAEHRVFLTSVDTSGNESARSEYTTFTPTPPVDADRIREELDQARQERQEYRDAFEERTTEYDRLMAEQEDALAETDAWGHTAVYRADQAAAEAIAARDTAERAEDNAAAARETADGSLELQHITEPEGTGSVHGQRWVQYDTMGRDRKILGVWTWNDEDKTWDAVSHDVTYLPMADITQATIGDAEVQRIIAEIAEAQQLLVGDFENLLPEEALYAFQEDGTGSRMWLGRTGSAQGWTTASNRGNHPIRIRWQGDQGPGNTSRLDFMGIDGRGIPAKPGDTFHLSMSGWAGTSGLSVQARYAEEDDSFVQRETLAALDSDTFSQSWEVPDNGAIRRMALEFTASSSASGNADFGDIELRRGMTGELIVDGITRSTEAVINRLFTDTTVATSVWSQIVRTRLLEADEALIGGALIQNDAITVDHIAVTESLIFEIAQGIRLEVDQLASNDIVGMNIRGGLIEGVQVVGSEVMTSEGWASSGGAIMRQDGTHGHIVTANSSGQVTARLGGDRNELANVDVDGDITARSIRLAGAAYVGSGAEGEGALVPDNGRLRIQGRLPLAEGGARDTFTYDFSPLFEITNTTNSYYEEWDVVYEEPAPSNNRGVLLQASRFTTSAAVIGVTTPSVSAAGFRARVDVQANVGNTHRIQLRYLSIWR